MFYDHEIRHRNSTVTLSGSVTHFELSLYINCILVISHPDDGHGSGRNMSAKNNTLLNKCINARLYKTLFNAHTWNTQSSVPQTHIFCSVSGQTNITERSALTIYYFWFDLSLKNFCLHVHATNPTHLNLRHLVISTRSCSRHPY